MYCFGQDKAASGEEKQREQEWDECCFIPLHIFIATYKHISFAWLPARLLSSISNKHPRKPSHTCFLSSSHNRHFAEDHMLQMVQCLQSDRERFNNPLLVVF